jgi:hypothetical protein
MYIASKEQIGNFIHRTQCCRQKKNECYASLFHCSIRGLFEGAAVSTMPSALPAIPNTCNVELERKEFRPICPIAISGVKIKKQSYIVPRFPCRYAPYSLKSR